YRANTQAIAHESGELDFRGGAFCLRGWIFIRLSKSPGRDRSIAALWRGPGDDDHLGAAPRRTAEYAAADRARARPGRTRCPGVSRAFGAASGWLDLDVRCGHRVGSLFAPRQ